MSDGLLRAAPLMSAMPAPAAKLPSCEASAAIVLCCCCGGMIIVVAVNVGVIVNAYPRAASPTNNGPKTSNRTFSAITSSRSIKLTSSSLPVGGLSAKLEGSVMWSLALMNERDYLNGCGLWSGRGRPSYNPVHHCSRRGAPLLQLLRSYGPLSTFNAAAPKPN